MKKADIVIKTASYVFLESLEVDRKIDESEALDMAEGFLADDGCDDIEEELQEFQYEVVYS